MLGPRAVALVALVVACKDPAPRVAPVATPAVAPAAEEPPPADGASAPSGDECRVDADCAIDCIDRDNCCPASTVCTRASTVAVAAEHRAAEERNCARKDVDCTSVSRNNRAAKGTFSARCEVDPAGKARSMCVAVPVTACHADADCVLECGTAHHVADKRASTKPCTASPPDPAVTTTAVCGSRAECRVQKTPIPAPPPS